jgi:NAD(P)-dependent dehydrogenase (short-subunit alcohol dehydrogenase family)
MSKKKEIIFILGGSGLIGKSIVNELSSKKSTIVILDIKKIGKVFLKNKNIKFEFFDCLDTYKIEKKLESLMLKYGCPKVFINSSYAVSDTWSLCNFGDINVKIFLDNIIPSLTSNSILSNLVAKHMVSKKINGSIINIGSIYGSVGQDNSIYKGVKNYKENMVYSILKSGLIGFTKQMTSYYAKYGIRINMVSPGGLYGHNKSDGKKQNKVFLKNYEKRVPMKRLGYSDEVANVVCFLSSDKSSYINGANIMVDGGWTAI